MPKHYKKQIRDGRSHPAKALLNDTIALRLWDFAQCDPKRCTGLRLCHRGLCQRMPIHQNAKGLTLSATAQTYVSPRDRSMIENSGIALIDCSWEQLDTVKNVIKDTTTSSRRLPFLVAANPVKYGKPYTLSCAEAAAACLIICGFLDEAECVLREFCWGEEFVKINQSVLDLYQMCENSDDVERVQNEWLETVQKEQAQFKQMQIEQTDSSQYCSAVDLPPEEVDDDDDEYNSYDDPEEEPELDSFGNYIVDPEPTESHFAEQNG